MTWRGLEACFCLIGSVGLALTICEKYYVDFAENLTRFPTVQKLWKSVNIWQSYHRLCKWLFQGPRCTYVCIHEWKNVHVWVKCTSLLTCIWVSPETVYDYHHQGDKLLVSLKYTDCVLLCQQVPYCHQTSRAVGLCFFDFWSKCEHKPCISLQQNINETSCPFELAVSDSKNGQIAMAI